MSIHLTFMQDSDDQEFEIDDDPCIALGGPMHGALITRSPVDATVTVRCEDGEECTYRFAAVGMRSRVMVRAWIPVHFKDEEVRAAYEDFYLSTYWECGDD